MLQTNTTTIILEIERMVTDFNLTYIEAGLDYCEKNNLEIEFFADLVKGDSLLKAKVEMEAQNLLLLKNSKQAKSTPKLIFEEDK